MIMSKDTVKNALKENFKYLSNTYGVKNIGFFGSFARGDNKSSSDIDILVEFREPISMFKFIDLENYLGRKLNKKVDLVTKKALKPAISKEVLQEVIYV